MITGKPFPVEQLIYRIGPGGNWQVLHVASLLPQRLSLLYPLSKVCACEPVRRHQVDGGGETRDYIYIEYI